MLEYKNDPIALERIILITSEKAIGSFFIVVGMQGIEPCLPVPKTGVLPVYDIPLFIDWHNTRQVSLFKVSYF